jgi:hypothetical protein
MNVAAMDIRSHMNVTRTQETKCVLEITPCQARPMISERQPKACRVFRTRQASISNTLPKDIDCSDEYCTG